MSDQTRPYKERSIEQLRGVVSMLAHFIWHRTTRPGDHMWSIPVDRERDWDCILNDAIDELKARRANRRGAGTETAPGKLCEGCGHSWKYHTMGGMCQGTAEGIECYCALIPDADDLAPPPYVELKQRGVPSVQNGGDLGVDRTADRLAQFAGYLNGYDAAAEADQRHAYNIGFADAIRAAAEVQADAADQQTDELHTGDDDLLDALTGIRGGLDELIEGEHGTMSAAQHEKLGHIYEDLVRADELRVAELKSRTGPT